MKRLFTGIHWNERKDSRGLVTLELDMPSTAMRIVEVDAGATPDTIAKTGVNRRISVIAVDVPFGWPEAFSVFASKWQPTRSSYLRPATDDLRYRQTDKFVRKKVFKWPANSATECLSCCEWIDMATSQGLKNQIDVLGKLTDDDGRATIIEADHIATMTALEIVTLLEKTPELDAAPYELRKQLIQRLLSKFNIRHNQQHLDTLVDDLRAGLSLVCAVTAMLYWCDVSDTEDGINAMIKFGFGIYKPDETQNQSALKEGWIFFPRPA